ncbi:MAG: RluA family pseudouridine synthase [Fusicatenibacter sp.]|nr:RluA family pseudouridine synthase [Fusicatenibacter sp.]
MDPVFTYPVSASENQTTVESFLRKRGYSHHILTGLKQTEDGICLNGVRTYTTWRLQTGDLLTVHLRETDTSDQILPRPVPFTIVYEDEHILVVNKPSDTPVHPSIGNYENTLANGVSWYFSQQGKPFVFRCINRLDRDTTGLVLLAKHALSGAILSGAMTRREIHRTYQAITYGDLPAKGTIDAPIARLDGSVIMRTVDYERGERSVTHYTTLARQNGFSFLELHLETGRTHQIRVHMSHIGHPLVGDTMYGPADQTLIARQALHSAALSFSHPITGEPMKFHCELPDDMKHLLEIRG